MSYSKQAVKTWYIAIQEKAIKSQTLCDVSKCMTSQMLIQWSFAIDILEDFKAFPGLVYTAVKDLFWIQLIIFTVMS